MVVVGETHNKTGDIAINLTLLYSISKDEDEFISLFSDILVHEQIHREITPILKRLGVKKKDRLTKYYFGEEQAVRALCNQGFNKKERSVYVRTAKNNSKIRRRSK